MIFTEKSDSPPDNYVLCGRGKIYAKHPGNIKFTQVIRACMNDYINATTKIEKVVVVTYVTNSLRNSGLKFVKYDSKNKRYVELSHERIHEKVSHAIRDQIRQNQKEQKAKQSANIAASTSDKKQSSNIETDNISNSFKTNKDDIIKDDADETSNTSSNKQGRVTVATTNQDYYYNKINKHDDKKRVASNMDDAFDEQDDQKTNQQDNKKQRFDYSPNDQILPIRIREEELVFEGGTDNWLEFSRAIFEVDEGDEILNRSGCSSTITNKQKKDDEDDDDSSLYSSTYSSDSSSSSSSSSCSSKIPLARQMDGLPMAITTTEISSPFSTTTTSTTTFPHVPLPIDAPEWYDDFEQDDIEKLCSILAESE